MTAIRVILRRGRSKPFWIGHPWVFSGAIFKVEGTVGDTGGQCLLEDDRGNVVGSGFYNPHGRIAVRILQHRRSTDLDFAPQPLVQLLTERLDAAIVRRETLGLPNADTTAYRLVNSEGDSLSGLIIDRLGDVAVVHLNSRAMYDQREALADLVESRLQASAVVLAVNETASRLEVIPVGVEVARGTLEGAVEVLESGLRYRVDPVGGQKTGFYADQRDNRRRFAALCEGHEVLDLYTYIGGFGLAAARAGAARVDMVDTSGPAARAAQANAELNGLAERTHVHNEDAVAFLKASRAEGRLWPRIVCDPPKFARGRGHVEEALQKYARLNTLALASLSPGGLLLTCSCSQHISEEDFLRMLTDAGHRLRKTVHVHEVWRQAPDHPFASVAPEGAYLKAALVSLGDS